MPDAETERAGPYRLLGPLGEGGMGVVHRALDDQGREVAIKLLRPELATGADFRGRLAREVDTMRRVRGPYVAEVLDADVSAERPYIVTRFIQGRPLDDVVRDGGPLSGDDLRRLAAGLADALAAIHAAGVVHRDLKPNNVMVVGGTPVVIDFGIAHVMDATRITRLGQAAGTPGYMGPELIDGMPPGPAADVYGWAATVAYAASGRTPYGSGSLDAVLARIAAGRPDLADVPPWLEPLLRAALDRDPRRRPSAAELARRVREAAGGERPPRPPLSAYKALAYLSIGALSAACAALPVVAGAATVAAVWYLRAGDAAVRRRRVSVRTAGDLVLAPARAKAARTRSTLVLPPALAYAGLVAVAVAVVARGRHADAGTAARWAAFAFGYAMLAAPRAMAPRHQLVRLLSALAPDRRAAVRGGLVLAGLTVAVAVTAWTAPPSWWPLRAPYEGLGRLARLLSNLW